MPPFDVDRLLDYKVDSGETCPNCGLTTTTCHESTIAATGDSATFEWACEECGHVFRLAYDLADIEAEHSIAWRLTIQEPKSRRSETGNGGSQC